MDEGIWYSEGLVMKQGKVYLKDGTGNKSLIYIGIHIKYQWRDSG